MWSAFVHLILVFGIIRGVQQFALAFTDFSEQMCSCLPCSVEDYYVLAFVLQKHEVFNEFCCGYVQTISDITKHFKHLILWGFFFKFGTCLDFLPLIKWTPHLLMQFDGSSCRWKLCCSINLYDILWPWPELSRLCKNMTCHSNVHGKCVWKSLYMPVGLSL